MGRPQKVTYQDVADTIDRLEQRGVKRPTQQAVADELGVSLRTAKTYWPTKSPEILVVERAIEGTAPMLTVESPVDENGKPVRDASGHPVRRSRTEPPLESIAEPFAGVIDTVLLETILKDPTTGEPFRDGRTVLTELQRQAVESCRDEGTTVEGTAEELNLDEERVKYLRRMPSPE